MPILLKHALSVLTDHWGYELLGGLVEDDEHPAASPREAREECGWAPLGQPQKLIEFEPLPGNLCAPVEVFLWRDCQHVGEPTDIDEAGRVEWVPLPRIYDLITRGQILGAGSLIPLLYLLASLPPKQQST